MPRVIPRLAAVVALLLALFTGGAGAEETPLWKQFVKAKGDGSEPILPDFSYAGYHRGERAIPDVEAKVFDVTGFGAIPDDDLSDQAAIQKALDAAAASGGGIVRFPPGRFLINTDRADMRSITLKAGNVVLRGSGCGKGGTVIHMVESRKPRDPKLMYSTPWQIVLGGGRADTQLANVTADARRETFSVEVSDASNLKVGQWVTLSMRSTEAVETYLAPYKPRRLWKRMFTAGIQFAELHRIRAIDGRTVTFTEPLRACVHAKHGWKILTWHHVEEVGVEDICFMGGWDRKFKHHRSALDDSGWSGLQLRKVANGWVRRCSFVGWNQSLILSDCASTSVLEVRLAGAKGHGSVYVRGGGDGVLVGLVKDESAHHHGPSVGYRTSGVVFWRYEMGKPQRIDSHSGTPIATLMDRVEGGVLRGSGGPGEGLPNHLRQYVLWNFNHRGKPPKFPYDFWHLTGRDSFVKPILAGLHGRPVKIKASSVQVNEGQGQPVEPESLYEAQLKLRLGAPPPWIAAARSSWSSLAKLELPTVPQPASSSR